MLDNLSNCLSDLSRSEDALEAIEEAVEIARTVVAQQPRTFQPELAEFLNSLSNRLFALDRQEPGLVAIEEAVRTMREPFLKLPEAFAERMRTIIRTYHIHCKSAQKQPDGVLLGPIDEVFRRLQVSSPGETAWRQTVTNAEQLAVAVTAAVAVEMAKATTTTVIDWLKGNCGQETTHAIVRLAEEATSEAPPQSNKHVG